MVLECVQTSLAKQVTSVGIPTIGIGASNNLMVRFWYLMIYRFKSIKFNL